MVAPGSRTRFAKRGSGFFSPRRAIAAVVAIIFTLLVTYFWGIPMLADRVAEKVPVAWEETVGRSVVSAVTSVAPACENPAAVAALDRNAAPAAQP